MRRVRQALLDWLPVALWMLLIFAGSSNVLSSSNTSRFLRPLLLWLLPNLSPETLQAVQYAIRKGGHIAEYAVLAVLLWRAITHFRTPDRLAWRVVDAGWTLLGCILYAASDEWHQSMVSTRYGTTWDVLWDGLGAVAGLLLLLGVGRWRRWF